MAVNVNNNADKFGFTQPLKNSSSRYQPPPSRHCISRVTGGLEEIYTKIQSGWQSVEEDYSKCLSDENFFQPHSKVGLLAGRYQVVRVLGKGNSSTIVQAQDTFRPGYYEVAIKILKPDYYNLGYQESHLITELNKADIHKFSGIVKLLNTFTLGKSFFCLTFELLQPWPLHQIFRKISDKSQKLGMIRRVALRMLQILGFLGQQNVIHADLKPENILATSENLSDGIKVIDFGNAIHGVYEELSLYYDEFELQTLLYRAPEVVLGLPFGQEIDMWSLGCILAECYMGKPLFWAKRKEDLLEQMTTLLGPLPTKTFQRAKFFTLFTEFVGPPAPFKDTYSKLGKKLGCFDFKFVSFIQGMLALDPGDRLTVAQAVQHPFIAPEMAIKFVLPVKCSGAESSGLYPAVDITPSMYTHTPAGTADARNKHLTSLELLRHGTSGDATKQRAVHVVTPFVPGEIKGEVSAAARRIPKEEPQGEGNGAGRIPDGSNGARLQDAPAVRIGPLATGEKEGPQEVAECGEAFHGHQRPSTSGHSPKGGVKATPKRSTSTKVSNQHGKDRHTGEERRKANQPVAEYSIPLHSLGEAEKHQPVGDSGDPVYKSSKADKEGVHKKRDTNVGKGVSQVGGAKRVSGLRSYVTSTPNSKKRGNTKIEHVTKPAKEYQFTSQSKESNKPVRVPKASKKSPVGSRGRPHASSPKKELAALVEQRAPPQQQPDDLATQNMDISTRSQDMMHGKKTEIFSDSSEVPRQQFRYLQQQRTKAMNQRDKALGINIKVQQTSPGKKSRRRTWSNNRRRKSTNKAGCPESGHSRGKLIFDSGVAVHETKDVTLLDLGKKGHVVKDSKTSTTPYSNPTQSKSHRFSSSDVTVPERTQMKEGHEVDVKEDQIAPSVYDFESSPTKLSGRDGRRKRSLPTTSPNLVKRSKTKPLFKPPNRGRANQKHSISDKPPGCSTGVSSTVSAPSNAASAIASSSPSLTHPVKALEKPETGLSSSSSPANERKATNKSTSVASSTSTMTSTLPPSLSSPSRVQDSSSSNKARDISPVHRRKFTLPDHMHGRAQETQRSPSKEHRFLSPPHRLPSSIALSDKPRFLQSQKALPSPPPSPSSSSSSSSLRSTAVLSSSSLAPRPTLSSSGFGKSKGLPSKSSPADQIKRLFTASSPSRTTSQGHQRGRVPHKQTGRVATSVTTSEKEATSDDDQSDNEDEILLL